MSAAAFIGVDWGTTNLRAFRFDANGAVIETRRSGAGLSSVSDRGFERALLGIIEDWVENGATRVLVSGMAGAREGWAEAPYAPCPADLAALAAARKRAPAARFEAWIAPGLSTRTAGGAMDVMRGEETQIFGAIDGGEALVIAPGTHSKWAACAGGRIVGFRSYMTGELFALLKAHSILARLMDGDAHDEAAFDLGLARARGGGGLSHLLFSVRAEGLLGAVPARALSAYLSGLLIGAEIADAQARGELERPVIVIAAPELGHRYGKALRQAGAAQVALVDGEAAAARGLWRLAQSGACS